MKKLWIGLTTLVLVMGIGAAGAYAATTETDSNTNNGKGSFEQMLPHAKQMHPDLTDQQIKDMYKSCHTNNGTGNKRMMDNSQSRGSMMDF